LQKQLLNKKLYNSILVPLTFPVVMWIVYFVSNYFEINLSRMGIFPRNIIGALGIFSGPVIHANFSHLLSNTIPLLILGWVIFYFYPKVAYRAFIFIYLLTGIFVWLFARQVYHIGASGVVYGFVAFLFFSGIFRRDNRSIAIALLVTFLYGGIIWGVLPGQEGISWESHLFGGIAGIITAFIFRKIDPPKKYEWEDEPDDYDVKDLEVSYDPEKNKFNF
jgi:membrane associated rhomboid family serine protease